MYFVVLALLQIVESYLFIITWLPFYAWFRLFVHFYLVLPGEQSGATYLYKRYVHPFLEQHEAYIDKVITEGHETAKAAGLQYLKQAIELFKVKVLGMPPRQQTPPHSRQASYTENLFSRFNMPSARGAFAGAAGVGGANDLFALLGSALQQNTYPTSTSRDAQAVDLSASGHLIPDSVTTPEERMAYVATQRERLRVLLQAFDKEAYNMASDTPIRDSPAHRASALQPGEQLKKSKSELEFEPISHDDADSGVGEKAKVVAAAAARSWSSWVWGKDPAAEGQKKTQ
ncbi:hypothetical protein B0A49_12246 [Cryomyces minteri]|uniref:Protein YOP1 n=2 Tax=Cryomyces minteri TaxID=331657 RepID=A0A4U0VN92_9PEZI|nr:hypothetical protein B0A49_12246 [Cryomyces minteri]